MEYVVSEHSLKSESMNFMKYCLMEVCRGICTFSGFVFGNWPITF